LLCRPIDMLTHVSLQFDINHAQNLDPNVKLWNMSKSRSAPSKPHAEQTRAGSPSDDYDLAQRAVSGDRAAFSELLVRHYDFIYRTAYKWCGQQSDAEDIAQDVCVKLAGALKGFDGRSALRSWLYRITLNALRDTQRAGARQSNRHTALAHISATEAPPEQEDAATQSELWRAVRDLPQKQRDAVLLIYAEDLTHREAASIMDVKESTVSWYVHEAKKTLKGLL
jgi:RNA polymerase sigma factor (sigma-70 family)